MLLLPEMFACRHNQLHDRGRNTHKTHLHTHRTRLYGFSSTFGAQTPPALHHTLTAPVQSALTLLRQVQSVSTPTSRCGFPPPRRARASCSIADPLRPSCRRCQASPPRYLFALPTRLSSTAVLLCVLLHSRQKSDPLWPRQSHQHWCIFTEQTSAF